MTISVIDRFGRPTASTGSQWEPLMGYSRAVRSGNTIAVSGTVGVGADGRYSPSIEAQTRRSLEVIIAAVEALGGKREHIVRTRIYTTRIKDWTDIAKAHGELFGEIRPATTLVEVAKLIDDEALIEIEADTVV